MIILINSDARQIPLKDNSVQCVITSPPYWGLRDYGIDNQIGNEPTPEEYVKNITMVFREVWRVLRDDGVLWLNLGDSYFGSGGAGGDYNENGLRAGQPRYKGTGALVRSKRVEHGNNSDRLNSEDTKILKLPAKNLVGIPWHVAFALQRDGWYLRQDIIWHKINSMPESVKDRCTKSHEYIFLLSKSAQYYFDNKIIRERAAYDGRKSMIMKGSNKYKNGFAPNQSEQTLHARSHERWQIDDEGNTLRNKRSVWSVATKPFFGAHFATFPPALVEPMILAGSALGDLVLDPFAGTATVGQVCIKRQRNFIGLELNPQYIELAKARTSNIQVAFTDI